MDEIVVKVSDLCKIAEQLKEDKMQYVRLALLEADADMPASIAVSAIESEDSDCIVDYDGIEAVDVDISL